MTLLTPKETAKFLNVSIRVLAYWRERGQGPPYFEVGARNIRYDREDLIAYTIARRVEPVRAGHGGSHVDL